MFGNKVAPGGQTRTTHHYRKLLYAWYGTQEGGRGQFCESEGMVIAPCLLTLAQISARFHLFQ